MSHNIPKAPNRAFISYGSPILIFLAFFMFSEKSKYQTLLLVCWVVHFTKRLLESRYVHIYSPGKNMHGCFSSSAFVFYIVFAFWIGYSVSNSSYKGDFEMVTPMLALCFFMSVALNFTFHFMLRQMKFKNQERTFPRGYLFEYVACPHYTMEILTWLFFFLLSRTVASFAFFIATTILLLNWSMKRHLAYKKMDGYPKSRKAIIPFVY